MAEKCGFPAAGPETSRAGKPEALPGRPPDTPDDVWNAVQSVRAMERLPGVTYREIPVPGRLSAHGIGVAMTCGCGHESGHDGERGHADGWDGAPTVGWIMLLYADEPQFDWGGCWRCVAFAHIPRVAHCQEDRVPGLLWHEVTQQLEAAGAMAVGGTVTMLNNTAFGAIERHGQGSGVELRVSWTPFDDPLGHNGLDAAAQVGMWARFIRSTTRFEEQKPID